jgi:hypothetical protein
MLGPPAVGRRDLEVDQRRVNVPGELDRLILDLCVAGLRLGVIELFCLMLGVGGQSTGLDANERDLRAVLGGPKSNQPAF